MKTVKLINPKNDSLIQQLIAFYLMFKGVDRNEKIKFDLSQSNWLYPLVILPVAAYIQETESEFTPPSDSKVASYLRTVHFSKGISSVPELKKAFSYIPIGVLRRKADPREKERLESRFAEMVYKILKPTVAAQNAIYYPLTELVTNIFEHSKKDVGYIFAQHYSRKEFLDLCIVDCGRGLARSYKEEANSDFTDSEAIKQALMGRSIKWDLGRGYGIRTSKRVICEGLGGSFVLLSGGSALYSYRNEEKIITLPGFYWRGVVVTYRIPRPKRRVNITPYLEG